MSTAASHLVCVSLPDYAIQILQREHGIDAAVPVVSVPSERPSARIVHCSRAARELGIRPGMSYAQALNLSDAVRAGIVTSEARRRAERDLQQILDDVAPAVEFSQLYEGAVWIDTRGLFRLFGGAGPWLRRLGSAFRHSGWQVRAVRGWTRAGTLVAAIQPDAPENFATPAQEEAWLRGQSLEVLPLAARDREHLRMLALTGIGGFLDMPAQSISRRFSESTSSLHRFLSTGLDVLPVQRSAQHPELRHEQRIEPPVSSLPAVLRVLTELLTGLRRRAEAAGLWIEALELTLFFEREQPLREIIRCGHATRDHGYLERLLLARCERIRLSRRFVTRVRLEARPSRGEMRQEELPLLVAGTRAGNEAASETLLTVGAERLDRSVALLQAELGAAALVRAVAVSGRFPEERYELVPLRTGRALLGGGGAESRRAHDAAGDGAADDGAADDGAADDDAAGDGAAGDDGPFVYRVRVIEHGGNTSRRPDVGRRVAGPYLLASAWWRGGHELRRYAYHAGHDGTLLWVYRTAGALRIQGRVS